MARGGQRGGARPGSGRKSGVPNKKTRAIQEAVEASGSSPLDVMIGIMRWASDEGEKFIQQCHKAVADSDDEKVRDYFEQVRVMKGIALDAATRAAPYVHGRVAAVEASRDVTPELPKAPSAERLEEMRKRYASATPKLRSIEGGKPSTKPTQRSSNVGF